MLSDKEHTPRNFVEYIAPRDKRNLFYLLFTSLTVEFSRKIIYCIFLRGAFRETQLFAICYSFFLLLFELRYRLTVNDLILFELADLVRVVTIFQQKLSESRRKFRNIEISHFRAYVC